MIEAIIAGTGEVTSATVRENEGLPPVVATCLSNVVRKATFEATGSETTLQVPIGFVAQR